MTITVTNTSGAAIELASFHFDGFGRFANSPKDWTLSILSGSDVTPLADVGSGALLQTGYINNDIDLSGLTDRTLDIGEKVIFELAFTGGVVNLTSGGHNTLIDNLAIVAVPEPSTMAMVSGLAVLGVVLLRRSRKS